MPSVTERMRHLDTADEIQTGIKLSTATLLAKHTANYWKGVLPSASGARLRRPSLSRTVTSTKSKIRSNVGL